MCQLLSQVILAITVAALGFLSLTYAGRCCNQFEKVCRFKPKPQPTKCETEWVLFEGVCYKMVKVEITPADAKVICNNLGAQLARPRSTAHEQMMVDVIQNHFWIGGNDRDTEGQWVWENGVHIDSGWSNWMAGNPNGGDTRDCMFYDMGYKQWDDYECGLTSGGMCVKKHPLIRYGIGAVWVYSGV